MKKNERKITMNKRFVVREKFVKNTNLGALVKISSFIGSFKNWFLNKIEEPIGETTLHCRTFYNSLSDKKIIDELGGEGNVETTLAEMFALMRKQANGEEGILLNDGYANAFYVRDVRGVLREVHIGWETNSLVDDRRNGWYVAARPLRKKVEPSTCARWCVPGFAQVFFHKP